MFMYFSLISSGRNWNENAIIRPRVYNLQNSQQDFILFLLKSVL